MLIIYGTLVLGGVETYLVRLAKARFQSGLSTNVLLQYPEKSNNNLLQEIKTYATVFDYSDIFVSPKLAVMFKLSAPIKRDSVQTLLEGVDQIHAFQGEDGLLGQRLSIKAKRSLPISIGFYHYSHYLWGGSKAPYYEQVNRRFVLGYLPAKLLCMFSVDCKTLYEQKYGLDLTAASTFKLGTITSEDRGELPQSVTRSPVFKICTVGRLVDFKTYNLQLLDTIKSLTEKHNVILDVYGDGPLKEEMQQRIADLGLEDNVRLKGPLEYNLFNDTVARYDVFVGAGSTVIQASAQGVPTIPMIDNCDRPFTYGFFCDVFDRQYGRKGLDIEVHLLDELLERLFDSRIDEWQDLVQRHHQCTQEFLMDSNVVSMQELNDVQMPVTAFCDFSVFRYELSRISYKLLKMMLPDLANKYRQNIGD